MGLLLRQRVRREVVVLKASLPFPPGEVVSREEHNLPALKLWIPVRRAAVQERIEPALHFELVRPASLVAVRTVAAQIAAERIVVAGTRNSDPFAVGACTAAASHKDFACTAACNSQTVPE